MPWLSWLNDNWFNITQTLLLGGTLWLTYFALRATTTALRTQNLFSITQQHREIWSFAFEHPELWRILDSKADIQANPPTRKEERFVLFLILHLFDSYSARRNGLFQAREHLKRDIEEFFRLPIPKKVWAEMKRFQDDDFVQFVDAAAQYS